MRSVGYGSHDRNDPTAVRNALHPVNFEITIDEGRITLWLVHDKNNPLTVSTLVIKVISLLVTKERR